MRFAAPEAIEVLTKSPNPSIAHTAAASNLGQMLNRICIDDGIALVNIVRKPEQEEILRKIGAKYICNATSPDFMRDLTQALVETGDLYGPSPAHCEHALVAAQLAGSSVVPASMLHSSTSGL